MSDNLIELIEETKETRAPIAEGTVSNTKKPRKTSFIDTNSEDFVINPLTNRKIKVGSDLYRKLVKAKVLGVHPDEIGRVLYKADSLEDAKQAIPKLPIVSDSLKPMIYKRNNKVVTKARKLKQTELNKQIQDVTLAVYEANKDKFNNQMSIDEIQVLIKKLVNEKLISEKNEDIPLRRKIEYLVEKQEEEEEDDDSLFEDDEDDQDDDENGSS